jgi:DNA-binding LacI/PurR family transcriptional regulator
MVRLKDIAARAGVTVMTVSKVMHDAPDISVATKARVRALADEMGYLPNTMARSLRSRTTRLLGVVIPSATNPVYSRVLLAVEQRAHELGYDLVLGHSLNQTDREEAVLRHMMARHVDGLLVCPVYRMTPSAPIYEELVRRKVKTVLLDHHAAFCQQFPCVETADLEASKSVTKHLLDLGHRRIAFFAGPATTPSCAERLEGYRRTLREAGLEVDDHLIFDAGTSIEEGEKAAVQLLQETTRPTAIQAVNDQVAIGAANHLLNQGVRIPADISVAGFGNTLTAEFFRVPLTTVRQPKLRLGLAAMDLLMKLIKGEPVENLRLPAELDPRQSTAAPKAG